MGAEDLVSAARRLGQQGYAAFKAGDYQSAERRSAESLQRARQAGAPEETVMALAGLMRIALQYEDWDRLFELAAEAEATASTAGDDTLLRAPLHMRAEADRMRGRTGAARRAYRASISLNERLGDREMVAAERGNLAWVEISAGRLDEAERLVALCEKATAADDRYGAAFVLLTRARIRLALNDPTGMELLAAADRILEDAQLVWDPAEQRCHAETHRLAESVRA